VICWLARFGDAAFLRNSPRLLGIVYCARGEEALGQQRLEEAFVAAPEEWMEQTTQEQVTKLKALLTASPLKKLSAPGWRRSPSCSLKESHQFLLWNFFARHCARRPAVDQHRLNGKSALRTSLPLIISGRTVADGDRQCESPALGNYSFGGTKKSPACAIRVPQWASDRPDFSPK